MNDGPTNKAVAEFDRLALELEPVAKAKDFTVERSPGRLCVEQTWSGHSPDVGWQISGRSIAEFDGARNAWVVTEESGSGTLSDRGASYDPSMIARTEAGVFDNPEAAIACVRKLRSLP